LRSRVQAIVFVGLSESASFEFHLEDLVRDVQRPTDVPTRPEVEKLAGLMLTCVRGADEEGSFCLRPVAGMRVLVHEGGHRAGPSSDTAAVVLKELGLAP
jgi:type IV secretory pathway VirJ component